MDLNVIRGEIEHMRRQILRQRKEIQDLQRAGISTVSAEELLGRMQTKVDGLCGDRDRLRGAASKVSRHQQRADRAALPVKLVWYDANAENPPWIKALADVRHRGTREGYCYHHVQAIMLAIDQYAETALGNREFVLNKPHGIGGKKDNIP